MSVWNSFKKKVNETWSGADFWDKEENQRQRQQFAQPVQAVQPVQTTPSQGSSLRVQNAQPTQTISVDQPDYSNRMIKVDAPAIDPVNAGLNAGKSWEQISRETGGDVNEIAAYSKATRPNYGVARIEKPQQSNWNKLRDVIDANTDADKYRRQQGNDKVSPQEQKPITLVNPGNVATNTIGAIPRMLNTAGNQIVEVGYTAQQQFATSEYSAATEFYTKAVQSGDPATIAIARAKVNAAAQRVQDINQMIGFTKEGYGTGGGFLNAGTMYNEEDSYTGGMDGAKKIIGNTGEGMLDVVTMGMAGVGAKQLAKVGVKQTFKESGGLLAKNAIANTTQGGVTAWGQGGDWGDVAQAGATQGTLGTVSDIALAGGGSLIIKGKNKLIGKLANAEPTVKINNPDGAVVGGNKRLPPGVMEQPDTPVVSVKRANGALEQYTPKSPEELAKYQKMIDDNRTYNGEPNAIAGTPDANGDVWHISSGPNVKNNYTVTTETPQPAFKPTTLPDGSPIPIQKPNSTQSLADLLPNIGNRKAILTSPVEELKKANPNLKPEVIDRLIRDYGEEKTRNIIASTSDATGIRDMNGFTISQAKKRYGDPKVKLQGSDMSPEELASLDASAPPLRVETPAETPTVKVQPVEAPPVKAPVVDAPPSRLGKIADEFYESRTGDQKIKYNDLKRLGEDISKQVDEDFKAIGTTYADVARKVQEGARNGAKTLDEAGLTPAEAQIMRNAQTEMNYVRRRASTGRRDINGKDFGELYAPQQKKGQYGGGSLFEGFRADKPGNEFKRKNQIDLEDLDYAPEVIGEYITRYGDTKLYARERLARALEKRNPDVDPDTLSAATDKLFKIQDRVNSVKSKIGAGGLGLRKQVDDGGKFVDTASEMTDLGKTLGHNVETILDEPKGLTNGDRINSIAINGEKLGDKLGLNQHRDAKNFASKQLADAGGDRAKLAASVEQRLSEAYNIHPDDLEYAVKGINNMSPDLPEEVVLSRVQSTYQQAAKQQLLEELQHIDIQNPKLRKDVSQLTNQILREGTIEAELSQKIVSKALQAQNAVFRKLNVSSAMNELSDLTSFTSAYGKKTALKPDMNTINEFGLGEIDAAIAPYIKAVNEGKGLKDVLSSINDKTNLYRFVEHYKAAVVATSAKNKYMAKGIRGDELTKKVLDDYRTLALPVDAFTKTFLDSAPLYTQYMTWGVRNLQKEGRLATGKISTGVLEDMSTKQRIARNAYVNLPAKTVFWLSSNGLKGTGILTAFGLTDFTGLTNGDFSGIAEEDKSWFDETTKYTNSSTTLSLLNSIVQSYEKEQLKNSDKYKDADYNPYSDNDLIKDIANTRTPSFIKNVTGTNELRDKGYSENKSGRVQYEAPDDFYNIAKSYLFGKGQTDNAREYSGRQGILGRDGNPITNIKDMAAEQIGLQDTDYTRPLNEDYSNTYKTTDEAGKKALLKGGRAYNGFLDDLKKNEPEAYDNYISSLDGNHVSPEYWKEITKGGGDLTAFNALKERNKQKSKDLKTPYDPIYDLPDDQAKAVLEQKSAATGSDIALRNVLYKEQWYKDYMDKVRTYYDNKEVEEGGKEQTQRVVDWYNLNDQYTGYKALLTDKGETPEWASVYPMVYQQKAITDKYGFDSQESKNFFKANGDQYKAEKDAYDTTQLDLINKMRVIEGYPPMTAEQYAQATNIKNTDDKKGSGYGSSDKKVNIQQGDFGSTRSLDLPSVKIKVAKQKRVAKYAPKNIKIKRSKAKM